MRFVVVAVISVALSTCFAAQAAESQSNEPFAREMMGCAFKHVTFAFGPGDASVAQNAATEAEAYLAAAVEASSEDFVRSESVSIKSQAQDTVFAAMTDANGIEGIIAAWKETKHKCDQELASFNSASDL